MPELTCILHLHFYTGIHNTRSAGSRFQNVSITPACCAAPVAASAIAAATAAAAKAAAAAAAAATAMTAAVAMAATTSNNAYQHGEGSLEPYLGLR